MQPTALFCDFSFCRQWLYWHNPSVINHCRWHCTKNVGSSVKSVGDSIASRHVWLLPYFFACLLIINLVIFVMHCIMGVLGRHFRSMQQDARGCNPAYNGNFQLANIIRKTTNKCNQHMKSNALNNVQSVVMIKKSNSLLSVFTKLQHIISLSLQSADPAECHSIFTGALKNEYDSEIHRQEPLICWYLLLKNMAAVAAWQLRLINMSLPC